MDLLQETTPDYHLAYLRSSQSNVAQFDSMMVDSNENAWLDDFTSAPASSADSSLVNSSSQSTATIPIIPVKPEPAASMNWLPSSVEPQEATITLLAPVPRRRGRPRKTPTQSESATAVSTPAAAPQPEPTRASRVNQTSHNSSEDSDEETEPSSSDRCAILSVRNLAWLM